MGDEYFKNKYRVPSTRLGHWNYADEGFYYVTICTKDRKCCLGEIKDNNVYLSEVGKVVFDCWLEIPKHFNNIRLDDWIIMPNHVHGIIQIECDENDFAKNCRDRVYPVSTRNKFGHVKPKSLSSVVNTFKGAVTRKCHENNPDFKWQDNYYEHIIKNDEDYARIKEYIANNPVNWEFDRDNPINLK
ncbi:MAG: transposase [Patescibacteria group bacterium]|nr:transposase [Patescibacteria group bacterium]